MPSQAIGERAGGALDDVLGGDSDNQILALRDYLMVLNHVNEVIAQQKKSDGTVAAAEAVAVPVAN